MNTIKTEDKIEVKPGYKKTAVGIIPEDWEMQKMKEMGKFYRGKGIPKKDLVDEGLNAIRYGEIYTVHHYFIKEFYSFIAKETANTSFLLNKGDVLFTGSGETLEDIGKSVAFISDEKAYAGGDITILRPKKNEYYSKFLGFLTNNDVFRKQTYRAGQGQSVVHIYPSDLKKVKLPIPPLPEQKAIADCLSTWDKGIEKLSALIASKKEQKKGLMQQLLTGKKRLDGFTEEWEEVKLEDLAEYRRGSFPQPYGLAKWYDDNGMPFIQVYDVDDNFKLKEDTKRKISDLAAEKSIFVPKGTLIITIQGSIGRLAITDYDAYMDRTLLLFTRFKKQVNKYFIMYQLYRLFQIEKERAPGGTIKTITIRVLSKFTINITSIEEQNTIAGILNIADKEIELLEQKLEAFKIQKKGLMQVLLTGTKRLV